jgi:ornithine cyclodeaminase/alanine dehydrogenase-like protein (mu-crystallin family)
MSELLDIEVVACDTPEAAVAGSHILSACTNAVRPVVFERMLEPGMHLTSVAGEFAPEVFSRIDVGVGGGPVSQIASGMRIDQSRGFPTYMAGSLEALHAADGRASGEAASRSVRPQTHARVTSLNDLMAGRVPGRLNDQEISASGGVGGGDGGEGKQGLQFVSVASLVYDLASKDGLGHTVPTEWFLQDIRD